MAEHFRNGFFTPAKQRIGLQMRPAAQTFRKAEETIAPRAPGIHQGGQGQEGAKHAIIRQQ